MSRVTVASGGLDVGGTVLPLVSGEVHFWRVDELERVLDAVRSLGFRFVSTYIPWSVWEASGGLDIERFLSLVAERDMYAIVRPGPNAGAELPTSGWPRRVVDDPRSQARRPSGQPYLLVSATHHFFPPSFASRFVLDEVARWYDEIVPRIARMQYPDGPVVLCQVDNEMGYHFQGHAYALDHHPDALAAYGASGLDWMAWREEHLRASIALLAEMQRERGITVPQFHNDYPRTTTPLDPLALEASGAVDVAAADVYATKEGGRFVRDLARWYAGSSKLPFLAELGAGWLTLPWLLPMGPTAQDEEHVTLRAIGSGFKAVNVYMLVDRDRWFGAPIARDGTVREKASLYRRLHELLHEIGWVDLRRSVAGVLVDDREVARRAAARAVCGESVACFSQVMPLDQRLFDPGVPADPRAAVLDAAGVDYDRSTAAWAGSEVIGEVDLSPRADQRVDLNRWGDVVFAFNASGDDRVDPCVDGEPLWGSGGKLGPWGVEVYRT